MTWLSWHEISERAAADAHVAMRRGDADLAQTLFQEAAQAETSALNELDLTKERTLGITAVSATSLWFKAQDYAAAECTALKWISSSQLPEFARDELRELLQAIWAQAAMKKAQISFLPGQVLVSISGGQTVSGGAPLDLVVERVQAVQSLFYRTVEFLKGLPHRSRGAPPTEIQQSCRPWLFQAAPGSYQFSVALQEPTQADIFQSGPTPPQVAKKFLAILQASSNATEHDLAEIVPMRDYQATFLKLSRNLAPNGKSIAQVEIRSVDQERGSGVILSADTRKGISEALAMHRPPLPVPAERLVELRGILRAVHLDKDWLEIVSESSTVKVRGLSEAVDDVIGPMINRQVVVKASIEPRKKVKFIDIETDE